MLQHMSKMCEMPKILFFKNMILGICCNTCLYDEMISYPYENDGVHTCAPRRFYKCFAMWLMMLQHVKDMLEYAPTIICKIQTLWL